MKKALMKRLFFEHEGYFVKRKVFAHCKAKFERARRIRRLERAVSLSQQKRHLQNVFDALRSFSHNRYVKSLGRREEEFRVELESKILV